MRGPVAGAHYLGPYLPDLSGALLSFWVLFLHSSRFGGRKTFADFCGV